MISIIMVVKNGMPYIRDALESYLSQNLLNKELVVVYSKSTDRTLDYLNLNKNKIDKIIIDKKGKNKFDSINLGIKNSTGDIIGILHADDKFCSHQTLSAVNENFKKNSLDILYGNCLFVKRTDPTKVVRYWRSNKLNFNDLKKGWMPPHTTLFVKKKIVGMYNSNYKYSADFDYINRIFTKKRKIFFLNKNITIMRAGGDSAKYFARKIQEDYQIFKENNLKTNFLLVKYLSKLQQLFLFLHNVKIKFKPKKKLYFISSIEQLNKKLKNNNNYIIAAFNFSFFLFFFNITINPKKILLWRDGFWANFFLNYTNKKYLPGRILFSFNNIRKINCRKNIYIIGTINSTIINKFKSEKIYNCYFVNLKQNMSNKSLNNFFSKYTFKKNSIAFICISSIKQELLAEYLLTKKKISSICCGAAMNMNLGIETPAPKLLSILKIEFLWRLRFNFFFRVKRLINSINNFLKYKNEI